MKTIKPIETVYKGYRFRSRLEARWAVFFDALQIEWKYEPEGFDLGEAGWYLPDFWLPHPVSYFAEKGWGLWAEMKATKTTDAELEKMIALARHTKHNGLLFQGYPGDKYTVTKISRVHFDPPKIFEGLRFYQEPPYKDPQSGYIHRRGYIHLVNGDDFGSYPCAYGGDIEAAYDAARQARFEHGQVGAPHEWERNEL